MVYDPKTKQFAQIDTCFDADHNHFAHNAEQTLYFGQNNTLGWVDTAVYEKTKNAEASQGWCPAVVDTTGDGRDHAVDRARDSRPNRPRIGASRSAATRSASTRRTAGSGVRASDRATTSWFASSAGPTRR